MEEKRGKGITALGTVAIVLNCLYLAPFAMLLAIPTEGDTVLKIPLAAIPFLLTILGIFCGSNLIHRIRLGLTLNILKGTIIYYILLAIFAFKIELPDIVALIVEPIILNLVMFVIVRRPAVKKQFK
ncbi:MAG: hypothetical protein JW869_03445 [Candidatus Omnitrophica bacterium]|nr:hypothetical protein [Candidatus Omnitrophota bacterium]